MTVDRVVLNRDGGGSTLELWSDHPAAQELPHLLWPDEVVRFVFSAAIMRSARPASRRWLIVLTDQRLICMKGRAGSTPKVKDILYDAMISVTNRSRILRATVIITTSLGRLRLLVSRSEAQRIVQAINSVRRVQPLYFVAPAPTVAAAMPVITPAAPVVAALPPAEPTRGGDTRIARLESTVERLEAELAALQQQIEFLEQLLRTRV